MSDTVQARDCFCVATPPLASMVRSFVDRWYSDRPPKTAGRFRGREARVDADGATVNPLDFIVQEARPPGAVSRSNLENIVYGARYPVTPLRLADAIVTALDRPEALQDGTLTILRNERASARNCCGQWRDLAAELPETDRVSVRSCCGGSLNGAGHLR